MKKIKTDGYKAHLFRDSEEKVISLSGNEKKKADMKSRLEGYTCVKEVMPITNPYKLSSFKFKGERTVINLDDIKIGGDNFTVIAGPCSVEDKTQLMRTAEVVKKAGAQILRGGVFKPRTSPYSFQGLGEKGLKLLDNARQETGLKIITELMDLKHLESVAEYTDIIQIGSRNMQNYPLLKAVGKQNIPIMLKRGFSATVEEWLLAAEYIMAEGNHQVILCERGIRTFSRETRFTMDISSIPIIKRKSHLPIIADPSHGTGRWELVSPMAKAATASGADGLMVEVHPEPEKALSDGRQSLRPEKFERLMEEISSINSALSKNRDHIHSK